MPGADAEMAATSARPIVVYFLQGLKVGGMERCVLQLAQSARRHGYDSRIVLYDTPFTGSADEYDPGDLPVAFVPRKRGIDPTLPVGLAILLRRWRPAIVHARNNVAGF